MRLRRVSLLPATPGQMLPANVTAQALTQSGSSASWGPAGPWAALPPAHVYSWPLFQIQRQGVPLTLENVICLLLLFSFLFPRSAAASDFYPLPLITPSSTWLGFQKSNFFKYKVCISVSSPSCIFQGGMEKGWHSHVHVLSSTFSSKKKTTL